MYWDFVEMPLAMYVWGEDRWVPLLATSWEIQPPDKFVVKLREGVKWSDGSDFTAQDVITTFETGRLMNWVVWRFVSEIQAPDDHTVVFTMSTPSTVVVRYVLRERIRAHSVYGDFARRVKELVAQGVRHRLGRLEQPAGSSLRSSARASSSLPARTASIPT